MLYPFAGLTVMRTPMPFDAFDVLVLGLSRFGCLIEPGILEI
jgi:hypothetical protein